MKPNDDVLKKLDDNYQLIPMKDITDEARALAVRWCENYRPMGSINLEQKHKLASDIMNYAKHYAESLPSKEEGWISVRDRLPELKSYKEDGAIITPVTVNVIVWDNVEKYSIGSFYSKARGFDGNPDITHWMYYPQPPTS